MSEVFLFSLEIQAVNLLQLVFATVTSLGARLLWQDKTYRSLGVFFLFQSALMLLNFLEETQITRSNHLITPAFTLAVGPLLYLVVRSLVNETELSKTKGVIHSTPLLLAIPFTHYTQAVIAIGTLSQILYLAASFKLLKRYHLATLNVRSDAESLKLTWFARALVIFAVFVIIDLVRLNTQQLTPANIKAAWYFLDLVVLFCISLYLLLKVMKKPELFRGMISYEELARPRAADEMKDEHNTAMALFQSLQEIIIKKELFRQPRLTIADVAKETGLNIKNISWAINLGAAQNFCEYINTLRINDVKSKIASGKTQDKNLLELAFESGFNSKSTFNAVFKRELGMTPSQFKSKALS